MAQGRLILQDTFMVSDQDGGLLSRMKERRVFLFEQIVIFSEPLDKKKGFSTPGYLFKNSIKVRRAAKKKKTITFYSTSSEAFILCVVVVNNKTRAQCKHCHRLLPLCVGLSRRLLVTFLAIV